MKKKIFKYKKGDRVPEHIMRCDNPNIIATFNVDVFVTYNRSYPDETGKKRKYTVLIRPQKEIDFNDNVIFVQNNGALEGTFKCNKLLIYNPWGLEDEISEIKYRLWGIE